MKKASKLITLVLVIMVVFASTTVLAYTYYESTISIGFRSTLTGTWRSFQGSTHRIENHLGQRYHRPNGSENYCDFDLHRKNGWSYDFMGSSTQNLHTVGGVYSSTFTGMPDGEFRYYAVNIYPSHDYKYTRVDGFATFLTTLSSHNY